MGVLGFLGRRPGQVSFDSSPPLTWEQTLMYQVGDKLLYRRGSGREEFLAEVVIEQPPRYSGAKPGEAWFTRFADQRLYPLEAGR